HRYPAGHTHIHTLLLPICQVRTLCTAECCGYPISIFFIVVNEFCERFSYYAVLVLYFRYFLHWDDDLATSIYHAFVALCYLTPILGFKYVFCRALRGNSHADESQSIQHSESESSLYRLSLICECVLS
uniref:Uncharacterized protein n=1 Tax=Sinocyclocheilus grahami TaxID=75366 RepID=A0A672REZ0_SINGR